MRSAVGSVGQASISRAKSGSICVSRAKEWAKGTDVASGGVSVTAFAGLSLRGESGEMVKGFDGRYAIFVKRRL